MTDPFLLDPDSPVIPPFLDALETLFAAMDTAYEKVAEACGFHCDGCGDSCCQTRFYHHTLLEYLYLRKGWQALPEPDKGDILRRAVQVDNARTDSAGPLRNRLTRRSKSGRTAAIISRRFAAVRGLRRHAWTIARRSCCASSGELGRGG